MKKIANKNETNDPQHRRNRVFSIITPLPIFRQYIHLANVSFQDKVKIKQISFGVSVEHPIKKHGLKQPWGGYSSKNGLNFFMLVEEIWGLLYFGLGY